LQGGCVIDPGSGVHGLKDIAIGNGKIAAVQGGISQSSAREVLDVSGKIVLPGMIDTHAHVYQYVPGRYGMNADLVLTAERLLAPVFCLRMGKVRCRCVRSSGCHRGVNVLRQRDRGQITNHAYQPFDERADKAAAWCAACLLDA